MSQVRNTLDTIQAYLGRMSPSQRLLIGSLGVIALMTLLLVNRYAAKPTMVDLMSDDPTLGMVESLQGAGINATSEGGRLMVPAGQRASAIGILGERGDLPGDTVTLFENLSDRQDWKNSREQNQQQYVLALQNELGRVISQFRGVRSASVILDVPEPAGLGRVAREPTASATVFTTGGAAIRQHTVDAIANLISGARAGLDPANVRVIDGSTGQQRTPTSDDQLIATNHQEHAAMVETQVQRKLASLLAHVPGVVVAVTARVDNTRVSTETRSVLPKGEGTLSLPRSESTVAETMRTASRGAEPGVRSNQAADINQGSGDSKPSSERSDETIEFENLPGYETTRVVDPRGFPTFLAASVNIPEGYIRELLVQDSGTVDEGGADADQDAPAVSRDEVLAHFETLRPAIEQSLQPHLKTTAMDGTMMDGEVRVLMTPVAVLPGMAPSGQAGFLGTITGGGGLGGVGGGGTLVVGMLSVAALGMMGVMVKKASRVPELPSAESLVGIPPSLEGDSDVVGEADESEAPMAGIELDDDEVIRQKLLEQVNESVKTDPETAARLVGRWIASEE